MEMMTKIKTLALSALALSLVGCTIEEPAEILQDTAVFQAVFESPDTRTYIDDQLEMFWTAGDQVSLFTTLQNQAYRFTGSTGDRSGGFEKLQTGGSDSGSPLNAHYAVYPYQKNTAVTEDGTLSFVLPSVQSCSGHGFGLGANTMVAVTENQEDHLLRFRNVCGYLVVRLYGDATIREMSIRGNNGEKLSGAATCKPVYGEPLTIAWGEGAGEQISLDCGEGVKLGTTAESASEFWFAIPPVSFEKGFTISYTTTDGYSYQRSTALSRTLTRNVVNRLSPVGIGTTDLSAAGTANSYIVSHAGEYSFKATVKGNGSESVGNPESAEVLWESFGTATAPSAGDLVSQVSFSDGTVSFVASEKKGNAVIAVKDAAGKILWSWHIWLTDQPEEQVYYRGAGILMDRNLGATSATPGEVQTFGLLYQWGRKDPFLGGEALLFGGIAASSVTWPDAMSGAQAAEGQDILAFVSEHPLVYITTDADSGDWYSTEASGRNDGLWASEKTLYDPCPPGWRVPEGGESGVWAKAKGSSASFYASVNTTTCGFDFSDVFGNASTIWYPAAGLRDGSGSLQKFFDGYCWSGTTDNENARLLSTTMGKCSPVSSQNRSTAASIRCLKIGSEGYYAIESISLEKSTLVLTEGESERLTVIFTPAEAANKEVTWSSSDTTIAQVDKDGWVKALTPGKATLTVKSIDGGKTATCSLTVLDIVTGSVRVSLDKKELTLTEGATDTLVATISPEETADKRISWSNSNPSVISVDEGGKVTGLICGTADIVVTSLLNGKIDTCHVSVVPDETVYSWDGEVVTLQSGHPGLNLVIMGDGYVKADFDDGTYDAMMRQLCEDFFSIEPYTTIRPGFSVYYVKAPSPQRLNATTTGANGARNSDAKTKFSVQFTPNSTSVSGDGNKVNEYAKKALGADADQLIQTATILVVANQRCRAGTNHMSWTLSGDYGKACSIAYFGLGRDDAEREQLVHHEAGGHGFGLLADEYGGKVISSMNTSEWWRLDNQMHKYGVFRNVDKYVSQSTFEQLGNDTYKVTADSTVYWSDLFNTANNYESQEVESLGFYEGANTYANFFCRPTLNANLSIMNRNTGIFNAPSRRQIYYRYLRLSEQVKEDQFGTEEELNRFLTWDATMLPKIKAQAKVQAKAAERQAHAVAEELLPLTEPVLQAGQWKQGVFIPY